MFKSVLFSRFFAASAFALCLSSTAFAHCAPCANPSAYSIDNQRGVTVMRGNIPTIRNPNATLISQRKAAEKRAEIQSRRARRSAADARAAEAALRASERRAFDNPRYRYDERPPSSYFSGRYGYGVSVSRARGRGGFGGRGFRGGYGRGGFGKGGFRGGKAASRPVFSRGIRG